MLVPAAMVWEQPRTVGLVIDMSCLEYFGGDTLLSWDFLIDGKAMEGFRIAFLCSAENVPHVDSLLEEFGDARMRAFTAEQDALAFAFNDVPC